MNSESALPSDFPPSLSPQPETEKEPETAGSEVKKTRISKKGGMGFLSPYPHPPSEIDEHRSMMVAARFHLYPQVIAEIRKTPVRFGFGEFGKTVYYRTYSRQVRDLTPEGRKKLIELQEMRLSSLTNLLVSYETEEAKYKFEKDLLRELESIPGTFLTRQEHWHDTVIRVIEGIFSYRKDHMLKNKLHWSDGEWQDYARDMAISMCRMEWLPPGRGLWACGTEYAYERGAACLNNCGFTTSHDLINSMIWLADMLMCGCGIGVLLDFKGEILPPLTKTQPYVVSDNREGWAESIGVLINAYVPDKRGYQSPMPIFDYTSIRARGAPLRGFGGVASGPDPLIQLHLRIKLFFGCYLAYQAGKEGVFLELIAGLRKIPESHVSNLTPQQYGDLCAQIEGRPIFSSLSDVLLQCVTLFDPNIYHCAIMRRWQRCVADNIAPSSNLEGEFHACFRASYRILVSSKDLQDKDSLVKLLKAPIPEDRSNTLFKTIIERARDVSDLLKRTRVMLKENIREEDVDNLIQYNYHLKFFRKTLVSIVRQDHGNSDKIFLSDMKKYKKKLVENASKKMYDRTRLVADITNSIGVCIIAGNVRRSAIIILCPVGDETFYDLKNMDVNPERSDIMWTSNNSVMLKKTADFEKIPEITRRVVVRGEPGLVNLINIGRYGRVGNHYSSMNEWTREHEKDRAQGVNPCLTGDIMVQTTEGWHSVRSLVGKQFTAVVDGNESTSTEVGFFWTGRRPIYRIELDNGQIIKATENHPFLCNLGEEKKWVETKEIHSGSQLILSNNTGYKWPGGKGTHEEGYMCGQLIGNGSFIKGEPILNLWVSPKDNINEYPPAQAIFRLAESISSRFDFKGWVGSPPKRDHIKYTLRIKGLKEITDKFGIYPSEKKVPEDGSYEFTKGLIKGLFDAGGIEHGVSIRLVRMNIGGLRAVQRLLLALGITSKIFQGRKRGSNKEPLHGLKISRSATIKFRHIIGFPHKEEKLIGEPCIEKYETMVKNIEIIGADDVYDCTIPDGHAFTASGVVSHNCGEEPLEDKELCNLVEVFPPRCHNKEGKFDEKVFYQALQYATLYAGTVSLVPVHWNSCNKVIARNRRIGVSLSGICDTYEEIGFTQLTKICRQGYKIIRQANSRFARKAGVPSSIRVSTIKPSGSLSQLCGVSPGCHRPAYQYAIRRIRIGEDSPIAKVLVNSGYPHERDFYSQNTLCFEFAIQCETRKAADATVWEQMKLLEFLQREYSDGSVSCTIYFDPKTEARELEWALGQSAPLIKSCSMLPHTSKGSYIQCPYEEITKEEYEKRLRSVKNVDWSNFGKVGVSDGMCEKYCTNADCEI